MVAIFTGSGVGFERGSGSVLGSLGLLGTGSMGRGGEQLMFNAATGNFMVSQRDEYLVGLGLDAAVTRTYNSLGDLSDDNHDNWRQGYDKHIANLTGTANTAGSTVQRVSGDGSVITYTWDGSKSAYVATDGAGAYDIMTFNTSSRQWTWTDGDSQAREIYAEAGAYGSGAWNLAQQLDSDGDAVNFSYYGNGRLYQVTTADGSTLTYVWSGASSDRLDSVTTGYTDLATSTAKTLTRTSYTYDGSGRLATVRVDYTPNDNVVDTNANGTIEATEGFVTTYGYDGSGRVNSISQSDGSNIAITYDGSGRVSTMVETASTGVTRTTSVTYGAGYTDVTDPLGLVTRLEYDGSNRLTKITLPPPAAGGTQQQIQFTYDGNGNVTSVTDALGNATGYSNFDANGNAQTITDRLGNVVTRTYGAKNELLTETSTSSDAGSGAATHTVRYAYDAENHLRYRVSAEGLVTEYRYTTAGQLSYAIEYPEHFYDVSALGSGTALTEAQLDSWVSGLADKSSIQISYNLYDARGALVSSESYGIATTAGATSTSEGTSKSFFTYDQAGRLLARNAQGRNVETFVYDGMGRLTSSVDVNGATTAYVFNDAATTTTVTYANGLTQVSTYNKAGELISFAESAAATTLGAATGTSTYGYDKDGRLRWSQDATARKSYFIYDQVGRKVADVSSAGDVVEYRYDANSRLIATIAHGLRYTGSFTALDNADAVIDPATYLPASNASDLWSWTIYDKEGRVLQAIAGDGTTNVLAYDGAGRLISTTGYFNKLTSTQLTTFKTTLPTAVTLPTSDAKDSIARSFYDKDGRLLGVLDGEGYLSKIVYDMAGQKVSATSYYNATSAGLRASGTFNALVASITLDAAKDRTVNYVYDGQGQLRFAVGATGQVLETQYDSAGQATTVIAYANALAGGTSDFTYDNVKALVTAGGFASASDRKSWTVYDSAGRAAYVIDAEGSVVAN
ncbi:hypothetical protein, partial [Sphingomonas sp.]|uniref:hypothetical protein n=1 Tax=Sphingomonas sp. TaxID=28214 RepID=UPI0025EE0376